MPAKRSASSSVAVTDARLTIVSERYHVSASFKSAMRKVKSSTAYSFQRRRIRQMLRRKSGDEGRTTMEGRCSFCGMACSSFVLRLWSVPGSTLPAIRHHPFTAHAPQPVCERPQHNRPADLERQQPDRLAGAGVDLERCGGHRGERQPREGRADALW